MVGVGGMCGRGGVWQGAWHDMGGCVAGGLACVVAGVGACMIGGGHSEGMHGRGVCVARGVHSMGGMHGGVCVAGGCA